MGAEDRAAGAEPTLEQALQRLEEIAERLEGDALELGESLALYEEGVRLVRRADQLLGSVEERVQQLHQDGAGFRLEPLEREPE